MAKPKTVQKRSVDLGVPRWFGREASFKAAGSDEANTDRLFQFTASDGSVDRMGDTIDPDGWDISRYLKNPVIQYSAAWGHSQGSTQTPVGQAVKVWVEDDALKVLVRIDDATQLDKDVFAKLMSKTLRAVSVGFIPHASGWVEDDDRSGIDFTEQELAEITICPVPANANALAEERTKSMAKPTTRTEGDGSGDDETLSSHAKCVKAMEGHVENFAKCVKDLESNVKKMGDALDAGDATTAGDAADADTAGGKAFLSALDKIGLTSEHRTAVLRAVKAASAEQGHAMHPDVLKCVKACHKAAADALNLHNHAASAPPDSGKDTPPANDGDEGDEDAADKKALQELEASTAALNESNAALQGAITATTGRLN